MKRSKRIFAIRRNLSSPPHPLRIKKIGVVGLGLMGHGIVQVSAVAGFQMVAIEHEKSFLEFGIQRIEKSLSRQIKKSAPPNSTEVQFTR